MNFFGNFSSGAGWPAGMGRTISGVMITSSSRIVAVDRFALKELAQHRDAADPGNLGRLSVVWLSSRPGDHEALAALQFDFGLHAARARGRES